MNRLAPLLLVLALAALPVPAAHADPLESALGGLVNAERRAHGLAALSPSPALARSAGRYARSLLERGVLEHRARIAAPRRFRLIGENLALVAGRGARPARVVRMWLASPAHRHVMLHAGMREAGVGRASGRFRGAPATVWVLHVGRV